LIAAFCITGLPGLSARAAEPLIKALKDKDWEVREQVARALGKISDVRAVEVLSHIVRKSQDWKIQGRGMHIFPHHCWQQKLL